MLFRAPGLTDAIVRRSKAEAPGRLAVHLRELRRRTDATCGRAPDRVPYGVGEQLEIADGLIR
jgi:hypothetical protein